MQPVQPQDARFLETAFDAMPVAVSWAALADQKIIFMNRKFTEIFGYILDDIPTISDWIGCYPLPEDQTRATNRWGAYFDNPTGREFHVEPMEVSVRCKDGAIKTVIVSGVILPQNGWALATFVDITARKRDETLLHKAGRRARESEAIYRLLLDHSPEMIVLSPFGNGSRYVSPAVLQVTGFTAEEYLAQPISEQIHPEDFPPCQAAAEALRAGQDSQTVRYRTLQKEGGYRWVEAILAGYVDPDSKVTVGYVATVRDIAEEVERDNSLASEHRRLAEAALLDELTGIANRRAFNVSLSREARRQTRTTGDLSILLLDVDHFKQYNDRYGHLAGDSCLWNVAQAIEGTVGRDADLVARFGGEEFVVFAPMTTRAGAEVIARRILAAIFNLEFEHLNSPFGVLTVSIGVTTWPADRPIDPILLLEQADRALYLAKSAGRNTHRFLSSHDVARPEEPRPPTHP